MRREVVTELLRYQYIAQRARIPCDICFVDGGSLVGVIDEVPSVAVVPKGIMATTTDHNVGGVFDLRLMYVYACREWKLEKKSTSNMKEEYLMIMK